MRQLYVSPQKKQTKKRDIFFCMEYRLLITKEPLFWMFRGQKIRSFLSQKVDGNMMFTDYWKVLVLNFSVMGNTAFFESRSWWKENIYWLRRSSCFELFGDGKYGFFFQLKSGWKDDIYLAFFSFPRYSRTWEIRFFVQC